MKAKKPRHSEATKKRARQLRRDGLTYPQIAAEVGASEGTVYYWLNPRYARRCEGQFPSLERGEPRAGETEPKRILEA